MPPRAENFLLSWAVRDEVEATRRRPQTCGPKIASAKLCQKLDATGQGVAHIKRQTIHVEATRHPDIAIAVKTSISYCNLRFVHEIGYVE